jgi:hypothetical protein
MGNMTGGMEAEGSSVAWKDEDVVVGDGDRNSSIRFAVCTRGQRTER